MPRNWRDEPRDRWRDDDRPYRDDDFERRTWRGDDPARAYDYPRGRGRGDPAGGPRRGRWGREEDYASGYRDHYVRDHGRARDRAEYGDPDRPEDEDNAWLGDDRRDRHRRDAPRDDEADWRRGHGPYGRYRDDW